MYYSEYILSLNLSLGYIQLHIFEQTCPIHLICTEATAGHRRQLLVGDFATGGLGSAPWWI